MSIEPPQNTFFVWRHDLDPEGVRSAVVPRKGGLRVTPVFQTTKTNCLSAAVASLLHLRIEDVPDWWELTGDAWLKAICDWAAGRHLGVCYFSLRDRKEWPLLMNHHVIVAGDTTRSTEYHHAVVAMAKWDGKETRLEFVHDPCPDGDFITNPDHCLFFVVEAQ